jgi:hypothetical protein
VANAWVGTTVPQSILLERVIEYVILTGKSITLAVKSDVTLPRIYDDDEPESDEELFDDDTPNQIE